MEKPLQQGPSKKAKPEDRVKFSLVCSYDRKEGTDVFNRVTSLLREGDVIAYSMPKNEARLAVLKGQLNKIGYHAFKYGHLGIVVNTPAISNVPVIFSSVGFKGPNCDDTFDTLHKHDWDVYRLDKWVRVDTNRFYAFIRYAVEKAGKWYGYDFSGVLGLWNSRLTPETFEQIGHDYICSTIVVAALYYSGIELDAIRQKGIADVLTPRQLVDGGGRIIPLPDVQISAEKVDKREGTGTTWYENGQKKKEFTSKDGKLEGTFTIWHENGQKKMERTFKNGTLEGRYTWWYENGQKMQEHTFKDGKREGPYTSWYENGQKKMERTFKDGKKEGTGTYWDEDGNIKRPGIMRSFRKL